MEKTTHEIHQIKISEVSPADYNPRSMNTKEHDDLKASLERFGFVDPIIINTHPERKGIIVGGHQRMKVWREMGNETVPAVFVELTLERERELNIRLNKAGGSWNWDLLEKNFAPQELTDWGFTDKEMFGRFKKKTVGDDEAPGLSTGEPKAQTGDLYQLGRHRILCGDSTKTEDVQKLMNGERAEMVFTDPPYNVDYKSQATGRKIENDNMSADSFRTFLQLAFDRYKESTTKDVAVYCCYASLTHREFHDSLEKADFRVKQQIIWMKPMRVFGWGDYHWQHEPILYCSKNDGKVGFYGSRSSMTCWEIEPTDEEILKAAKKMIEKDTGGEGTVWKMKRDTNYKHPTQKPVELAVKAIENSSKRDQIVLDLFMGSGTTLIAAEKTGRSARGMEMDRAFVDVIVQRYVDFCIKNGRDWSVSRNNVDISSEFAQQDATKEQR